MRYILKDVAAVRELDRKRLVTEAQLERLTANLDI